MPIFEYKCNECEHTMEFLEKAGTSAKHVCEKCGSDMRKLLSGFAVGRSKAATRACQTCPGGPCQTDLCQTDGCPHSL